ncbi:MAG: AmmeMemoRadiSam system protein B [Gammaproteobacteria bacterium]|jgi:AmmeMemoRadiSam system protein B
MHVFRSRAKVTILLNGLQVDDMQTQALPRVRPPAVAGRFYAADPATLSRDVQALLGAATRHGPQPKAIIVPHAGYVYSGAVAASAYALLGDSRTRLERVVLLGPSHRHALQGMAVPAADAFMTPLGTLALYRPGIDALAAMPGVQVADAPHALDHALEVQLPFLQAQLDNFSLLPIAVGACQADLVADALECVWGGAETLVVVSTDLSHFHRDDQARVIDRNTSELILRREATLTGAQACGCHALNGLLKVAQRRDLKVQLLDRRTSADSAGDRARVVGYASFAVDAA